MQIEGSGEKGYLSIEPWGGPQGVRWDDGVHSNCRRFLITHGVAIISVQFEYEKSEGKGSISCDKHGGGVGGQVTHMVKLDDPDETFVSLSGHCGRISEDGRRPIVIRSLTFDTNKRRYGPFGVQQGTPFSTAPINDGKIVGFHGRASYHVDAIGVHMKPLLTLSHMPAESKNKMLERLGVTTCGPWGGQGGTIFNDRVHTGVREVQLTRNGGINSIRVCYDNNNQAIWGGKNGGGAGLRIDKIVFDYPAERLTHISGYFGSTILRGPTVVRSLCFHTDRRKYGPFGEEQGISFSSPLAQDTIIVGFHGKKGWFIDSIGVHLARWKPLPFPLKLTLPPPVNINNVTRSPLPTRDGVRKDEVVRPYEHGPWGGDHGEPWDDGVFSDVKKICIIMGDGFVRSLQFEYDLNGQSVWSAQHGGRGTGVTQTIKLQSRREVLTCMSGYYGTTSGEKMEVVKSLSFYSNMTMYGPFGEERGTPFSSKKIEGKMITGFHGRSNNNSIVAIGVHMQQSLDGRSIDRNPIKGIIHKIFT